MTVVNLLRIHKVAGSGQRLFFYAWVACSALLISGSAAAKGATMVECRKSGP
jgi:hypothetical protein